MVSLDGPTWRPALQHDSIYTACYYRPRVQDTYTTRLRNLNRVNQDFFPIIWLEHALK